MAARKPPAVEMPPLVPSPHSTTHFRPPNPARNPIRSAKGAKLIARLDAERDASRDEAAIERERVARNERERIEAQAAWELRQQVVS